MKPFGRRVTLAAPAPAPAPAPTDPATETPTDPTLEPTAAPTTPPAAMPGEPAGGSVVDAARTPPLDSAVGLAPDAEVTPEAPPPDPILELPMTRVDGTTTSVRTCLQETDTDAFVVVHGGIVVAQWYRTPEDEVAEHALMSITKSVVGCAAGILIAQGCLDPDLPAAHYVPELLHSGYAQVSVRELLDMRTADSTDSEDYVDPHGELAQVAAAVGEPWPGLAVWTPGAPLPTTLRDVIVTATRPAAAVAVEPVSRPFCYRSLDTETLGWVLERAAGRPILELIEGVITPLRLEAPGSIAVDAAGVPQASGGLALRARDVATFALMLLHGGAAGDTQVVPTAFVKDTRTGGPDSTEAMLARVDRVLGPGAGLAAGGGFYRNQFWIPRSGARTLLCLGIHGQLAFIDSETDTVVIKLSSWPTPQNPVHFTDGLECARAVAHHLGGRDPEERRGIAGRTSPPATRAARSA